MPFNVWPNKIKYCTIFNEKVSQRLRKNFAMGPRKRKVRLLVPEKFTAVIEEQRIPTVHSTALKWKNGYFDLIFDDSEIVKGPNLKQFL